MKPQTTMNMLPIIIGLIIIVGIGFITCSTALEQIHPVGPMTGGDENIDPYDPMMHGVEVIPWNDVIYVPEYPGDECPAGARILIDTPIKVIDTDGTVYWHWFYENRDNARNRSDANYISDPTQPEDSPPNHPHD